MLIVATETPTATRRSTSTPWHLFSPLLATQPISSPTPVSPFLLPFPPSHPLTPLSPQRRPAHRPARLGRLVQRHRHRLRRPPHHQHRQLPRGRLRLGQARRRVRRNFQHHCSSLRCPLRSCGCAPACSSGWYLVRGVLCAAAHQRQPFLLSGNITSS